MDIDEGRSIVRRSSRPTYRDYDRPSSREDDVYRRRLMEEKVRPLDPLNGKEQLV